MSISVDIEKKLGNFNLKVAFEDGNETLALLGGSGCGKSMTLKCIAGIEKPDKGRIVLDGNVLFDSEKGINLSPQERHIGLVFQNYALFPNMTVLQNIEAGAKREKDKAKRAENVEKIINNFGLKDIIYHFPSQLSGGQQQRVALGRMLVSNPDILMLDEPLSALDSHLRFRLEQEIREVIHSFGKTVILVSHDRDEVYRMADKIAIMNNGFIESFGEKHDVFASPKSRMGVLLTGCKNISAVKRLSANRIMAVDWGIELEVDDCPEDISYVGIRMHYIKNGGGENSYRCLVVEEIENPFSYVVMLRPAGCKGTVPIGWEMEKAVWESLRQDELEVSFPKESIILVSK